MLEFTDHRRDPAAWAASLGVSREAIDRYLAADVIDLHIDTFIWTRLFGYDLKKRHGRGIFRASFYGHADLPRLREASVTGGIWSITTNPLRRKRAEVFAKNLSRLREILSSCGDDVAIVQTAGDYRAARAQGKHAAFIGVQGGNALDADGALEQLPDGALIKVTVVHLSNSKLGHTSAPGGGNGALSTRGHQFVERLNAKRIFVDLAHISRRGFADAVAVHDKSQPLLVSHTGVDGVHQHWRNLDDDQLRAVAATGGVVGIMYEPSFLGDPKWGGRASTVVDHLEHIVKVVGDDVPALGSDWDGAIVTPRDMQTCLELPRLAQLMLERGWSGERIGKILGGNFLRALAHLRP